MNAPLWIALLTVLTPPLASAADGKTVYEATCIACHGPKVEGAIPGVPNFAKDRRLSKPDSELVANTLNGFQTKGSPLAMPPKGGNANLTAADAQAAISYMRTLVTPKK